MRRLIALLGVVLLVSTRTLSSALELDAQKVAKARFDTFNQHDLDGLVALYAPDVILTSPGFCHDRAGLSGARDAYAELFREVPDIQDRITFEVVDKNHVAVQFVARSASAGFEVRIADFLTLDHGLIVRDDAFYDPRGRPCS